MSADISDSTGNGAGRYCGRRCGATEIGRGSGGRFRCGCAGNTISQGRWAGCDDWDCGKRNDAVCLGCASRSEAASSDHCLDLLQSAPRNSEGVSAHDRDCTKSGARIIDGFNSVESRDGDEAVAEHLFDASNGEGWEGDWQFNGAFESVECEVA